MYKTKLQELCQKQSWPLPEYSHSREGPSHMARFSASVTVNDQSFSVPPQPGTSKSAQNEAARIAFLHFTEPQPISVPSTSSFHDSSPSPLAPGSSCVDDNLDRIIPIKGSLSLEDPQIDFIPDFIDSMRSLGLSDVVSNEDSVPSNNEDKTVQAAQIQASNPCSVDDKRSTVLKDLKHYKSLLHIYAQKRNLSQPVYSNEKEGPPHDSRFKSKVTVDGQTFESPGVFYTLREAEHAAAKIALQSLSTDGHLEEDSIVSYKNMLLVLVQKEGFGSPVYSTKTFGESHMPTFVATVKIEEEIFEGNEAKAKKQAESNAAKVAYITLTERKKCARPEVVSPECRSSPTATVSFVKNARDVVDERPKEDKAKDKNEAASVSVGASPGPKSDAPIAKTGSNSSLDAIYAHAVNNPRSSADSVGSKIQVEPQYRKVVVFPRRPNMTLPAGIDPRNVLPISNEEWTAVEAARPSQVSN